MKILMTGGAGFIGSNFVHWLLGHDDEVELVDLDALTYAGQMANLDGVDGARHQFVHGNIMDSDAVDAAVKGCELIINFAAESHVDRSISDPMAFVKTNVTGTGVLLDAARRHDLPFVQIGTDEVYGSISGAAATESSPLNPSSAYSASKAGADLLALSYHHTYGMDVRVTRCTNNYGPRQHPEKLIPRFVTLALAGKDLPLYGDGKAERDWLHVDDHCAGIWKVATDGKPGQVYNISADHGRTNIEVAHLILDTLGTPHSLLKHVQDRLGHDRRYSLDSSKLRAMGWQPTHSFDEGLPATVRWYADNPDWWKETGAR